MNGFYQVSVHLTKWTVVAMLVNGSGLNKQSLLKSFRSTDTSYYVSVHLAKRLQRRILFLEIDQSETKIACGGHVCQRIETKCDSS